MPPTMNKDVFIPCGVSGSGGGLFVGLESLGPTKRPAT
jgi:D-serine dehydratase